LASMVILVVAMLAVAEFRLHKYYDSRKTRFKRCVWTISWVGVIFWFVYWIVLGELLNPLWVLIAGGISMFAEMLVTIGQRGGSKDV
jgi:hypothetical protein